jgi:hypothetical protein
MFVLLISHSFHGFIPLDKQIKERSNGDQFFRSKRRSLLRVEIMLGDLSSCSDFSALFDVIFQRAKTEEWRALGDDFRTLLLNP